MDLYEAIVGLLVPSQRERALAALKGLVTDHMALRLDEKPYSARHNGIRSSRAAAVLSEFVRGHEFSPSSPSRALTYIKKYQEMEPKAFRYPRILNESVMDYGCGTHGPLSIAILLYINGANSVVAFDPGHLDKDIVKVSLAELAMTILSSPDAVNFSGIPTNEMKARFAALDWATLLAGDLEAVGGGIRFLTGNLRDFAESYSDHFDYLLSTTVLEHVDGMEEQAALMRRTLKRGGKMIHRIDLTDHRHFMPDYHPLRFMQTGLYAGLNGLRYGDFKRIFEQNGFFVESEDLRRYSLTDDFKQAILPEWRDYRDDDLEITYAGIVLVSL